MDRLLRIREVKKAVGLGRTTLYALIKQNRFPQPIKPTAAQASAWLESEIGEWIRQRAAERGGAAGKAPELQLVK
jgi:prophage regulatory protein